MHQVTFFFKIGSSHDHKTSVTKQHSSNTNFCHYQTLGTRGGHSHRRRSHSCDRGQGLFLVSVKRSRTTFKLGNSGQDVYVLHVRIAHSVVKCVWSNGQGPVCGAVKRSSNKNNSQNFLTPVAAVTTAPIGVTPLGNKHLVHQTASWWSLERLGLVCNTCN